MTTLLLVIAGGLGAATRLAADGAIGSHASSRFPWATAAINLSGSLLLGIVTGLATGDPVRAVVGTGFLGGYTTFSTASFETARLALDHRFGAALLNGLGVLVLGVAAASAGVALGQTL